MDMQISEALRDAIDARMNELDLSPTDLEEAAGVSGTGLMNLRRGEVRRYQKRLTSPVCRALHWTPDSIARILRGEEPISTRPVRPEELLGLLEGMDDTTDAAVERFEGISRQLAALEDRVAALEGLSLESELPHP